MDEKIFNEISRTLSENILLHTKMSNIYTLRDNKQMAQMHTQKSKRKIQKLIYIHNLARKKTKKIPNPILHPLNISSDKTNSELLHIWMNLATNELNLYLLYPDYISVDFIENIKNEIKCVKNMMVKYDKRR